MNGDNRRERFTAQESTEALISFSTDLDAIEILLGFPRLAFMTEIKEDVDQQCKEQASVALRRLQDALVKHVEDINIRLQAGLAVRGTPTAIEVYEIAKPDALLRFNLTRENNINYTQLIKRNYERQSGVIYVRPSKDGSPVILFSDFPHPNERVSYLEASKRLLNSCF